MQPIAYINGLKGSLAAGGLSLDSEPRSEREREQNGFSSKAIISRLLNTQGHELISRC